MIFKKIIPVVKIFPMKGENEHWKQEGLILQYVAIF